VFATIIEAMPALGNVMLLAFIVWGLFAVLGLHLFCGGMYACTGEMLHGDGSSAGIYASDYSYLTKAQCTGSYVDSHDLQAYRRVWRNADFNFDNIFNALYTMFVIATLDDWQTIMYRAIDSQRPDPATLEPLPPIRDNNMAVAFFFMLFVIAGSFFATSLFVGEIVHTYSKVSDDALNYR